MKLTKADELLQKILEEYGTADIAPVRHGKWVEELDRRFHWHCSECGYVIGVVKMDCNYCPNCGAKMDGGKDHETD